MTMVVVTKPSRLNGADVMPGEIVEIDDALARAWFLARRARKAGSVRRDPEKPQKKEKPPEEVDPSKMSKKKLLKIAIEKKLEVPDPNKITKKELIDLLIEPKEKEPKADEGTGKEDGGKEPEGSGEGTEKDPEATD